MKVKMLTRIEGTRNGVRWPEAGAVVDLPDGEAADLVTIGIAVRVEAGRAPEPSKPEKRPAAKRPEKRG